MTHPQIKCSHIVNVDPTFKNKDKNRHFHINVNILKHNFGDLETVCIKRDWFDRWLSSFEYIWQLISLDNLTPKYEFEKIDNEFIYNIFTDSFVNKLYIYDDDDYKNVVELYRLFVNEDILLSTDIKFSGIRYSGIRIIASQNFWTNNERCTYEFNIEEIDKFENFISDRYSIDFKLDHINEGKKNKNNIIVNDELKKWVWDRFERPFIKNKLI
jgi:hypothetical protein